MKKNKKAGFYPILINLQRFDCLVVGGGKVAYRKILSLLKFNADITVVSPKFSRPILELAKQNRIKIIKKKYSSDHIEDFGIVFCTTNNPETNKAVRKDCTEKGILLNVADEPILCDFILPANVIRDNLTISISSQGKAPFFTKEMKNRIEGLISPVYKDIFRLASEFRKKVLLDQKIDSKTRTKIFRYFTLKDWEKILSGNGSKGNKQYIKEILNEINSI